MSEYSADSLKVLEGLDPVRQRPNMYTDTSCPNHLAQEAIDKVIKYRKVENESNKKITR